MAGSAVVTKDDLKMAVTQYASKNDLTVSENENGFALMPGDIIVSLKDGKPECGNKTAWLGICDILSESREGPARAPPRRDLPARQSNTPSAQRSGQFGGLTPQDIIDYINPKATEQGV